MDRFYKLPDTPAIEAYLNEAAQLNAEIDRLKDQNQEIWRTIKQKLRIDWTYNSNAIEGSTLTLGETTFFLQQGLTVEGKPLKDFLDARNHAEAIDYLRDIIKGNRPISEGLIKEINSLLLTDVSHTDAIDSEGKPTKKTITPGQYKKLPNHVLQLDGTIHRYVDPLQVSGEVEKLCKWINNNMESNHPVVVGAIAHYNFVRIHPFDDGNGREARILMNLILMMRGYPPAIIRNEQRRQYLEALSSADNGNPEPFVTIVAEALINTQKIILDELTNNSCIEM